MALIALVTDKIAHIFNDTEDRYFDLAEHGQTFPGIGQRQILRGGDNHGPGQRGLLRNRQLNVTGSGRHIDDQNVQITPGHFPQHLGERTHHHRATPDHGRVLIHHKAHRHGLKSMTFQGFQGFGGGGG